MPQTDRESSRSPALRAESGNARRQPIYVIVGSVQWRRALHESKCPTEPRSRGKMSRGLVLIRREARISDQSVKYGSAASQASECGTGGAFALRMSGVALRHH